MLGQQPRLRRARRSTTSSCDCSPRRPRQITSATRRERENWLGPGHQPARRARATRSRSARRARDGTVVAGGERLTEDDLEHGYFVAPTVVADLPTDHRLFRDELFVPFVAVAPVDSIDEGIELANDSDYGLTAGFYGEDKAEQQQASSTTIQAAWST